MCATLFNMNELIYLFFSPPFVWLTEEALKCFSLPWTCLTRRHFPPVQIGRKKKKCYRASQKQHDIYKDLTISCNLIKSRSSERHTFHDKKTLVFLRVKGTGWLDCSVRQLSLKTKRQDCIFDKGRNLLSEKSFKTGFVCVKWILVYPMSKIQLLVSKTKSVALIKLSRGGKR